MALRIKKAVVLSENEVKEALVSYMRRKHKEVMANDSYDVSDINLTLYNGTNPEHILWSDIQIEWSD